MDSRSSAEDLSMDTGSLGLASMESNQGVKEGGTSTEFLGLTFVDPRSVPVLETQVSYPRP